MPCAAKTFGSKFCQNFMSHQTNKNFYQGRGSLGDTGREGMLECPSSSERNEVERKNTCSHSPSPYIRLLCTELQTIVNNSL